MIPNLRLPNGIQVPAKTVEGFLWGGRESGVRWLQELPTILESICQKHTISQLVLSPEIRMNLVLFGESAVHGSVVIKLAQPHPEVAAEIACLRYMSITGHYAELIDADETAGWSVQERVIPGEMLQTLTQTGAIADDDATRIIATLVRETAPHVPQDKAMPFPNLNRWLKSLWEYAASGRIEIPTEQIELAVRHAKELVDNQRMPMLLHGDFHHGNILKGKDGWVMIDPKGIIAEQAFEVGPVFYNPIGVDKRQDLPSIFNTRLDILSEVLEIDRVRLWKCAFVGCVLSDCWTLEDERTVEHTHFNSVTAALMQMPERHT